MTDRSVLAGLDLRLLLAVPVAPALASLVGASPPWVFLAGAVGVLVPGGPCVPGRDV